MGCIFIPLAWDFFSIKKKMSDYYGEYLFSSPYVAFLISKYQKLSEEFMFSSPPGAYLISILVMFLLQNIARSFRPLPGHI